MIRHVTVSSYSSAVVVSRTNTRVAFNGLRLTEIILKISDFSNIFPLYEQINCIVAASLHSRKLVRAHNLRYSFKHAKLKDKT